MKRATTDRAGSRAAPGPDSSPERPWLWFAGLWCAGLLATAIIAGLARWLVRI